MSQKDKPLKEFQLGDEINKKRLSPMDNLFDEPVRLMKISYEFQDKNGAAVDFAFKHDDYIEEEEY